jgi:type II secretory pathway component GspD/PulD (secretin)
LFKHQQNRSKKTELVILLRPLVVDNQQIWEQDMRDFNQRIQDMRQPSSSL